MMNIFLFFWLNLIIYIIIIIFTRILKQGAVASKCRKPEVSTLLKKKLHPIRSQKSVKKNCHSKNAQWASQ